MTKSALAMIASTLLSLSVNAAGQETPKLREDNIDEIVQAMTLEEKATLLVGGGFKSMLSSILGEKGVLVPGAAGTTRAIDRLGIPSIVLSDGPAGVRIEPVRKRDKGKTFYATAFPSGTLLASSWDKSLVEEVGRALGNEVLEYGIDVLLAPGMNLHRNPLCGRNFEYYSEDPVLTGWISASMIKGIQSNGVGTSAKHFALNNQETRRVGNDSRADERTARELYLKAFEIAVKEASPWTVMSSYNKVGGEWAQSNRWLLSDVLRNEWGFGGLVMTDWTGKRETDRQVAAGNDLMEPGTGGQIKDIVKKVKKGVLSQADLDICVKRVLELIVKTPRFKGYSYSNAPDLDSHSSLARKAAAESIILLRNEDVLPVESPGKVAIYGVAGYRTLAGGTGSGNVHAPFVTSIADALAKEGFSLDKNLSAFFTDYLAKKGGKKSITSGMLGGALPEEVALPSSIIDAQGNDLALFVVGRQAGEGKDRVLEGDWFLSETERKNLETVSNTFHSAGKKVVAVLNIGGVIEMESWKDLVDGILVLWQGGEEAADALADVLLGKANPSGKLPMTIPVDYFDLPSSANFPYDYDGPSSMNSFKTYKDKGIRNVDFTEYKEGLDVGYRYFSTSGKKVCYPFGFGMSYTSFEYSGLVVSKKEEGALSLEVTVKNTGEVKGKEIVQVYIKDPSPAFMKPDRELKAFAKTSLLSPGESETLRMEIEPYILSSFNPDTSKWECPESMIVMVGASVEDIRLEGKI